MLTCTGLNAPKWQRHVHRRKSSNPVGMSIHKYTCAILVCMCMWCLLQTWRKHVRHWQKREVIHFEAAGEPPYAFPVGICVYIRIVWVKHDGICLEACLPNMSLRAHERMTTIILPTFTHMYSYAHMTIYCSAHSRLNQNCASVHVGTYMHTQGYMHAHDMSYLLPRALLTTTTLWPNSIRHKLSMYLKSFIHVCVCVCVCACVFYIYLASNMQLLSHLWVLCAWIYRLCAE